MLSPPPPPPLTIEDVEFELNEASSSSTDNHKDISLIIVIDTSFLLENLAFFQELDSLAFEYHFVRIVIPWKVVKELEGLSSNGRKSPPSAGLREKAKKCSHILIDILMNSKESSVIGQRLDETHLNLNNSLHSNDDLILDCCEYFRNFYHSQQLQSRRNCANDSHFGSVVVQAALLTNDRNLALKASIHQVKPIVDWKRSAKELLDYILESDLMTVEEGEEFKKGNDSGVAGDSWILEAEPKDDFPAYSKHLEAFCRQMTQVLTPLMEHLLEVLLGRHWSGAVSRQPPWKFGDILQIALANWQFLFAQTFPFQLKVQAKDLMLFLNRFYPQEVEVSSKRLPSKEEFVAFQQNSLKMLRLFGGKREEAMDKSGKK